MELFSAGHEAEHDALVTKSMAYLNQASSRANGLDEVLNNLASKCTDLLNDFRENDDVVEAIGQAITAKSKAKLALRLARKFSMNPLPKSKGKFEKLMVEAEGFVKVSQHHLDRAENLSPRSQMKM